MKFLYVLAVFLAAICSMALMYEYGINQYTIIAFAFIGWGFLEVASYLHDAVVWNDVDDQEEVKKGNMAAAVVRGSRYIALALIFSAALLAVPKAPGAVVGSSVVMSANRAAQLQAQSVLIETTATVAVAPITVTGEPAEMLMQTTEPVTAAMYPPHVELFLSWVGIVETRPNRNWLCDSANTFCKVALGSSNCASITSYALHLSGAVYPPVRSARARAFITSESIALPTKKPPADLCGWLLIFYRQGGGHIAVFVTNTETVEANTSSGEKGSQHNGDGVWRRKRDLKKLSSPFNVFRSTHLTPVRYA